MRPCDLSDEVAVNPMGFFARKLRSAALARLSVRKGLFLTNRGFHGYGAFLHSISLLLGILMRRPLCGIEPRHDTALGTGTTDRRIALLTGRAGDSVQPVLE